MRTELTSSGYGPSDHNKYIKVSALDGFWGCWLVCIMFWFINDGLAWAWGKNT